nr:MAG TPA: hypothetical protein [Caudoviricetes sp.]
MARWLIWVRVCFAVSLHLPKLVKQKPHVPGPG